MSSYIIFGTGRLGKIILTGLNKLALPILGFIDNNKLLWGSMIEGIPVYSPDSLSHMTDIEIVIGVFTNSPVKAQLDKMGCKYKTFPQLARQYPTTFLPFMALPTTKDPLSIFEKCACLLKDSRSVREFWGQLRWRESLNYKELPFHSPPEETYFPPDLFKLKLDEVFVDCGAYDGGTIKEFLKRTEGHSKLIYAFEPDEVNYAKLLENNFSHNATFIRAAVSDVVEKVKFNEGNGVLSAAGEGNTEVDCVSLDGGTFQHPPTFIKMDIEGYEKKALEGARRIIKEHQPILAVCIYHKHEDLWEIPLLINEINPDYDLFIRRYSDECWELVCYAIPKGRLL